MKRLHSLAIRKVKIDPIAALTENERYVAVFYHNYYRRMLRINPRKRLGFSRLQFRTYGWSRWRSLSDYDIDYYGHRARTAGYSLEDFSPTWFEVPSR